MNTQSHFLGFGRTAGGVNKPIEVGDDGQLDGSAVGSVNKGPQPMHLCYGQTAGGVIVPLRVDAAGKLNIVWS